MYIACDIGGTNTRVACSADCHSFEEPIIFDTPEKAEDGLEKILATIDDLIQGERVEGVTIGVAGVLDETHSKLLKSPHLPGWIDFNLRELLEKKFGLAVYIENDTDLVGLGEYYDGAGREPNNLQYEIAVYVTVSTGIGGVKIVNGEFDFNRFGFEPGHMILNAKTNETWEELASGDAVERKFGKKPKVVAQTLDWEDIEHYIAVGLHNVILCWSPDILIVGGAMAKDLDAKRLKEKITQLMKIHPRLPIIKLAKLGSLGGIYGGFALLRKLQS